MSKFRVGDVVVYLWSRLGHTGKEATVLAVDQVAYVKGKRRKDAILTTLCRPGPVGNEIGFPRGSRAVPEQLRLKRPPSWDSWLYDTSSIPGEITYTGVKQEVM